MYRMKLVVKFLHFNQLYLFMTVFYFKCNEKNSKINLLPLLSNGKCYLPFNHAKNKELLGSVSLK